MPIVIDNTDINKSQTEYSPKFFDNILTGKGLNAGLLKKDLNPCYADPSIKTTIDHINLTKKKIKNGNTEIITIPFFILDGAKNQLLFNDSPKPGEDTIIVGTYNNVHGLRNIFVTMYAYSLTITTVSDFDDKTNKKQRTTTAKPCYHIKLWSTKGDTLPTVANYVEFPKKESLLKDEDIVLQAYSCTPSEEIENMLKTIEYTLQDTVTIDKNAIDYFISNYSLYQAICKRSEEWQTQIDQVIDDYLNDQSKNKYHKNVQILKLLKYIETYSIPLDRYKIIYESLRKHYSKKQVVSFCKENLNLLLYDTLDTLNNNRSKLSRLSGINTNVQIDPHFSHEQQIAIKTQEPLVLVQAGAGTGKSTVISARIDYMIKCGVDPNEIMVLSFTNAAADNIKQRNPDVHSMTIANMIHTIYTTNFKTHELSTLETMMNSIDIYFPYDDVAHEFKKKLYSIWKSDKHSFTDMNNFIEENYDAVIDILNKLQQTTLELEIIICYQQIENLKEPKEIQHKYLIIDEVQDNSIFEFIYSLKYIEKHQESLFMVGDCSQTLYEFRASNPRALNVLEKSGIFKTYQLQTNYRSNQEILDFANAVLSDIEANQHANIQLHSNTIAPITTDSFKDKVQLHYSRILRIKDYERLLPDIFRDKVYDYIDTKVASNEHVAFLAFTNAQVDFMEDLLRTKYPNLKIENISAERPFNSTILSLYIKKYWQAFQFIPTDNIMNNIKYDILSKVYKLLSSKAVNKKQIEDWIDEWIKKEAPKIKVWQAQYKNEYIDKRTFAEHVRDNLLEFEIKNNAIRQRVLQTKKKLRKQTDIAKDANILLSTIHSAKGLEFDNTVIIYADKADMTESSKRMYYVALTRAMKSEMVLAYGSIGNPKIEYDYDMIVKKLEEKEKMKNNVIDYNINIVQVDYTKDDTSISKKADDNAETKIDT